MPSEQAGPTSVELARLAQAFQDDPSSMAFQPLADAYMALGRAHEAIDVLARGLSKHPNDTHARLRLGRAYACVHSWKESQAELLKLAKLDRNNGEALGLLGEVLMRRSDYDRAAAVLQHALSLQPANSSITGLLKRAREGTPLDPPAPIPREMEFDDDEPVTVVGPQPDVDEDGATQIMKRTAPASAKRPTPSPNSRAAAARGKGKIPVAMLPGQTGKTSVGRRGATPQALTPPRAPALAPAPALALAPAPALAPALALPVNSADGEAFLNELLHRGVKTSPKTAPISAEALGLRKASGKRTFIALWVLLVVAGLGTLSWHFVSTGRRDAAIAAHVAAADEKLAVGTYEDYVAAAQELEQAILLDATSPSALARLASTRAMALLMFGFGSTQDADIALIAARRALKAAGAKDGEYQRDLAIAESARALAVLGTVSDPGGVLVDARRAVDSALKSKSDDEILRWLDGMILLAEGKRVAARAAFKKSRSVLASAIALADLDLDSGDPLLARKGYAAVLAKAKHPMAVIGLGVVQTEMWGPPQDVAKEMEAASLSGGRAFAWKSLADANQLVQTGQVERANEAMGGAAREKVGEPRFLIRFALTQLALGRPADAEDKRARIRYFGAALDQEPLLVVLDAHLFLARAMPKEALEILGDAQGTAALIARGRALLDLGQYKQALEAFEKALELAPEHGLALAYRDLARVMASKKNSALKSLASRAKETKSPLIAYLYGEGAMHMGNESAARQSFEVARADSRFAHRALVNLASFYLEERRLKDAEAALREAITRAPAYLPAHAGLGHLYLRSGNSEAARDTFAKVVSSGRGRPGDELLYAKALFATQDIDGAKQAVRRAQLAGADSGEVSRTAAMIDEAFVKELGLPPPR